MSGNGDSGLSRGAVSRASALHQMRNDLLREYFNDKSNSSIGPIAQNTPNGEQSETSKRRHRYQRVTDAFLKLKIKKKVIGRTITVRFSKDDNGHLYSDTFKRAKGFRADDLRKIPKLLKRVQFVKSAPKDPTKKSRYAHFYYFRVRLRGRDFFFNVGQLNDKKGNPKAFYLYSVTSQLKEKTNRRKRKAK